MTGETWAEDATRLVATSQQVVAAATPPQGLTYEPEGAGVVRVSEGRGGRPEIAIDTAWERSLRPADLGPAVSAALAAHLRADRAEPASVEPWTPRIPEHDLTAALNRLNAALAASSAQLASVQRRLAGEEPATMVANQRGSVRVQVQNGRLAGVEIDPAWASGKTGATIAMEIGDVLAEALDAEQPPALDPIVTDPYAALAFLKETL